MTLNVFHSAVDIFKPADARARIHSDFQKVNAIYQAVKRKLSEPGLAEDIITRLKENQDKLLVQLKELKRRDDEFVKEMSDFAKAYVV